MSSKFIENILEIKEFTEKEGLKYKKAYCILWLNDKDYKKHIEHLKNLELEPSDEHKLDVTDTWEDMKLVIDHLNHEKITVDKKFENKYVINVTMSLNNIKNEETTNLTVFAIK